MASHLSLAKNSQNLFSLAFLRIMLPGRDLPLLPIGKPGKKQAC
jgi:hypothetical protein